MWERLLRVTPYVNMGQLNADEIECVEEHWTKKGQAGPSAEIAKRGFKVHS